MAQGEQPCSSNRCDDASATGLVDNHGRPITYLRLAITDRCNLRCRYCMPETGVPSVSHGKTLRYEEFKQLVTMLRPLGIEKVRITGGEPLVRRGCVEFMKSLKDEVGIEHLYLTTNGVVLQQYLPEMIAMNVSGINLSLDTLDPQKYFTLTRRDSFASVAQALQKVLAAQIPLKINAVVAHWTTDEEILQLATLVQKQNLTLRFIEHMPFSGVAGVCKSGGERLLDRICRLIPQCQEIDQPEVVSTARLFRAADQRGTIGIIEGHSRNFCATCNKIRITPQGILKGCLYDKGILDLRELLRSGATEGTICARIQQGLAQRYATGWLAQQACQTPIEPSMASIGG